MDRLLEVDIKLGEEEVSFELNSGEVVGILGPLGSGKSSIVKSLAGLSKYVGSVKLLGRELREINKRELASLVGFVPESPVLQFVANRVGDEVAFALENLELPAHAIKEKISEALGAIGLGGKEMSKIGELSWGQRYRVALAAALASEPRVILMDDLFVYLDPPTRAELVQALRGYVSDGAGVIVASGRRRFIEFADRVVELKGTVRAREPPLRIPCRPNFQCGVSMKDVHFYYKAGAPVLKGISLNLHPNEIVAVLGRNGSGKTTLGKLSAKILKPKRGEVVLSDARSKVAYVSQHPDSQIVKSSPIEDVLFSLKISKVPGELRAHAEGLLSAFNLSSFSQERIYTLNLGVKKLVLIASVVALNPSVIIVDEPTSGLDDWFAQRLAKTLRELAKCGLTVALLTHDLELAEIADRAVVVSNGVINFEGKPSELKEGWF